MRDKPGKPRDFYHSCYALSGLSISQYCVVSSGVTDSSSSSSSSSNDGHRATTSSMDFIDNSFEGSSSSSGQGNMKASSAFTDWTGPQVRTFSVIFDDER